MIITALKELYTRDLNKLKAEIAAYKSETILWETEHNIKNSGGNLCLHIIGNLKTYIGNGLGNIGYVRNRPFEFTGKNVDRQQMLAEIDETIKIINTALNTVTPALFTGMYPVVIWKKPTSTSYTLIHIHSHLTYHLGQINYHRRLLDK